MGENQRLTRAYNRGKDNMAKSKTTTTKTIKKTSKKTTRPVAPKKSYKASELKVKQPSLIEELPPPPEMKQFSMMDFEGVYMVFDSLYMAFHPNGEGEDDVDNRFLALWTLFLASVNWTEDQFWDTLDSHEHTCPDCQKELEEGKSVKKETSTKDGEEVEVIAPKPLPSNKQFN